MEILRIYLMDDPLTVPGWMVETRLCVKGLAHRRERGMSHAGVSQNKAPVCLILALALSRGEGERGWLAMSLN